jgi:hypothetical protein
MEVFFGDHDVGRNRDKNDGGADEGLENDDSRAAGEIGGHDDCDEDSVGESKENEKAEVDGVLGLEAEERDDAGQGHAQGYVNEPCVGREVVARGVDVRANRGEADREQELEGENLSGVAREAVRNKEGRGASERSRRMVTATGPKKRSRQVSSRQESLCVEHGDVDGEQAGTRTV